MYCVSYLLYYQRFINIQYLMDNKQKDQHYLTLIDKQYVKAKQTGETCVLSQLIHDYEFSIQRTQPLQKNYINIQCAALFIANKFLELKYFIMRNRQGMQKVNMQVFQNMGYLALQQNFKELFKMVSDVQGKIENQLRIYLLKSVKKFIIKTLSRDYTKFELNYLKKNYNIKNEDLEQFGCKIDGDYVELKRETNMNNINELMETRIRQLSLVTSNVIKTVQSF